MAMGVCGEDLKTRGRRIQVYIVIYMYFDCNGPVKCNHNISVLYLYYAFVICLVFYVRYIWVCIHRINRCNSILDE